MGISQSCWLGDALALSRMWGALISISVTRGDWSGTSAGKPWDKVFIGSFGSFVTLFILGFIKSPLCFRFSGSEYLEASERHVAFLSHRSL